MPRIVVDGWTLFDKDDRDTWPTLDMVAHEVTVQLPDKPKRFYDRFCWDAVFWQDYGGVWKYVVAYKDLSTYTGPTYREHRATTPPTTPNGSEGEGR